jgi:hypothetical protein
MREYAQPVHPTAAADADRETTEAPSVWRQLEAEFRALPDPARELWAAESDARTGTWIVWGGPNDHERRESLQKRFRALAKTAAVAAHLTGRGSPVNAWLNHLKRGRFYRPEGRIEALCLASAECCRVLDLTPLEWHVLDLLARERYKTALGFNIDRLRVECGWSFSALAAASGIAKHVIVRHIRLGVRAKPQSVKAYADAFSRHLQRTITLEELRG